MRRLAAVFVLGMCACRPSESPAPKDSPTLSPALAKIRAIDMEGRPLANMMPIATAEPNAFDTPVARGALTNERGESHLSLPLDGKLFVRVWDPSLRYFANNIFEVYPLSHAETRWLEVTMAPSAHLTVSLTGPTGDALVDTEVELMLRHPTWGPWWPARSRTDGAGAAVFESLPPGKYVIALWAVGVGRVELNEGLLPPGESVHAGAAMLR